MPQEVYNHDTDQQHQQTHCELEKTLVGAACEVPGEVRYAGVYVCLNHALLLALDERTNTLMGLVLSLDRLAEAPDLRADELRLRRLKHQIKEAEHQLRISRLELDLAHMQYVGVTMSKPKS